jgi:hypothetical protein
MSCKLFVGQLNYRTRDDVLYESFSRFGLSSLVSILLCLASVWSCVCCIDALTLTLALTLTPTPSLRGNRGSQGSHGTGRPDSFPGLRLRDVP